MTVTAAEGCSGSIISNGNKFVGVAEDPYLICNRK